MATHEAHTDALVFVVKRRIHMLLKQHERINSHDTRAERAEVRPAAVRPNTTKARTNE